MSRKEEIGGYILRKIKYFEATETRSNTNTELARLRRGVGKNPGEVPELYGIFLNDMPEEFWSKGGSVTPEEWSCYIALTLYAVHQQGTLIRIKNMHTDHRVSIGTALRQMVSIQKEGKADSNTEERILKKLQMLISSKDIKEFSYHLRNIIKFLKMDGIALNYAELAKNIYDFQFMESKNRVSLIWGQDFYRVKEEKSNE